MFEGTLYEGLCMDIKQEKASTTSSQSVAPSYFSLNGIVSSFGHSVYEMADSAAELVKGSIGFTQSLFSGIDTHSIINSMAIITANDLVPIIAINVAMSSFEDFIRSQLPESTFALELGLNLAKGVTYTLTFRQAFEAFSRATIMQVKQASIFDNATKNTRMKVSDQVCKQAGQECSTMRFVKGNVRSPLFYLYHQAAIYLLKQFLSEYTNISGFNIFVDGYLALAFGQMILDYRLSNDGLCEPHQAIYNKQYWERGLVLGMPVIILSKLTSEYLELSTGVSRRLYKPMIETFLAVAMVGVAHQIRLPPPVKQAGRLTNPVSFVRDFASYWLDKVAPDLKKSVQALINTKGDPIDYHKKFKEYKTFYERVYLDPRIQFLLKSILPPMYSSLDAFVNDPVFRQFWPDIQLAILILLAKVEKYQNQAQGKKIIPKEIKKYIKPLIKLVPQEHLERIKNSSLSKEAWDFLETWLVTPALAMALGLDREDLVKALETLRDQNLQNLVIELQEDIDALVLKPNGGDIWGFFNLSFPKLKETPILDSEKLYGNIKEVIEGYQKDLDKFFSGAQDARGMFKSLLDSTLTAAYGGETNAFGKSRASCYLQALKFTSHVNVHSLKLLTCIVMLTNDKSTELTQKIAKAVAERASEYNLNISGVEGEPTEIIKLLVDQLLKDSYLLLASKQLHQPMPFEDFKKRASVLIKEFKSKSNIGFADDKIAVEVEYWFKRSAQEFGLSVENLVYKNSDIRMVTK